jgi:hypothetical protein
LAAYIPHQRRGDRPPAEGLSWKIKPAGKQPMILDLDRFPVDAVIKVNDEPLRYWGTNDSAGFERVLLDPADDGPFTGGQNTLELALLGPLPDTADPLKHIRLHQATANLTAKAEWSFSPWQIPEPGDDAFTALPTRSKPTGRATWFATTFSVASTRCPLFVHPKGMTKGQIILNGHNVGRYFVATDDGKPVPPQTHYYLPEPWLHESGDNHLLLFDEHGHPPTQLELVYNENGPYG